MATVSGSSGNYATPIDYVDTTYTIDGATIVVSASASAIIEQIDTIVRGGSVAWEDCGTWATWPNSKWSPGIGPAQLTVTSSATPSITRGSGTLDPAITLTVDTTGSAIFGPTVASNIVTTTDAQGNVTFSGASSADIVFTVDAEGGKLLHGVADPQLTLTAVVVGERRPGGTATAQLTFTTDATGVVRVVGTASADLVLTTDATGTMIFLGNATANLVLTTTLTGGLVQKPSNPNTTYSVPSETRIYVTEHDAINDTAGLHLGHNYYKLPINVGETRVYKVLTDTRTATVPSETRIQPTEVF
jgi:hypothetical protein